MSTWIEPSLVDEALEIDYAADKYITPKLPYYPSYSNISPAQRGVYLKFLENPYDNEYEIGYVFMLFYGLERHLLYGDKEQAIKVIHKLREIHKNSSFLLYSFNAMLFYYARSKDIVALLEYEYENLDLNNMIYFHLQTDKMLSVETVIKFRKSFGFKKEAFILKNPTLFQENLANVFNELFRIPDLPLEAYNFSACTPININFPANTSLENISMHYIKILNYAEMPKFKADVCSFFEEAYEAVKTKS